MNQWGRGWAPAVAVLALAASCAGDRSVERAAGSAVLGAATEVAALSPGDLADLRQAGVREVFLDAGRLSWEGRMPRLGRLTGAWRTAEVRLPTVLSVAGEWPARTEGGAAGQGAGVLLGGRLRDLHREATSAGLLTVGLHLDLVPPAGEEALEAYGEALAAVRREMPEDLWLAVSLDRRLLHDPAAGEIAAAADLLVPFLYGPRTGAGPGPRGAEAWDLAGLDGDLERLTALGTPYLVGVGTVGGVMRPRSPEILHTGERLGRLLADPSFASRRAPLFVTADVQIYPFVARRRGRLGGWDLAAGEELEARRLAPHHLRALLGRLAAAPSPLHLGQLYDRLPTPDEGMALTPAELAAASGPAAAAARLELTLERPRGGVLAVRLAHRGGAATEVAGAEQNFVEVRLAGGSFGAVEPGGFRRYELLAGGVRAADMAALRRADVLRLFVPYLEAGDEVTSGDIRHRGEATASGRFLMPDATVIEVAPVPAGSAG